MNRAMPSVDTGCVARARSALTAAMVVLGVAAAMPSAAALSVRDDTGASVTLAQPARRVLALGPHLVEIAFAAGAGDTLVGALRYSDYPEAAGRLPVVGDAFALNFELIAQMRPDLVLVWGSGMNDRQKSQLRRLRLPLVEIEIRRVEDIARALRQVGTLTARPAAEAAASSLESRWRALRDRFGGRAPVSVFYQLWHDPLMTVNREHLIQQAIDACGGVNAFADQPVLTPTLSWEAAVQSDPQVVVSADSRDEAANFGRWRQFGRVRAVRNDRLVIVDGNLIARMGPRFVDGAWQLCEAIDLAR